MPEDTVQYADAVFDVAGSPPVAVASTGKTHLAEQGRILCQRTIPAPWRWLLTDLAYPDEHPDPDQAMLCLACVRTWERRHGRPWQGDADASPVSR